MGFDTTLTKREFLGALGSGLVAPYLAGASAGFLGMHGLAPGDEVAQAAGQDAITEADLLAIEKCLGLSFSDAERKAALASVRGFRQNYQQLRAMEIPYDAAPSAWFQPLGRQPAESKRVEHGWRAPRVELPKSDEDIAFLTVAELAALIRSRKITSSRLVDIYLARLKKHGPKLMCVVTLMEDQARKEAAAADREIAEGKWRGPLHGIPYGIKDLFSAKGAPTTWGAAPFRDRVINEDAEIVLRLRQAGAVLCAKLTLGALAMDDQWFGGQTKNPWNPAQGSSGSSAGSASAMAAGLVAFTIGTETLGSIVSPSHRCRITGLRPTYGRVSRHGAMALSWTMDKAGPICRTAEDCWLVLCAIAGKDPKDPQTVDRPLVPARGLSGLKVGFLDGERALDEEDQPGSAWRSMVESLGVKLSPVKFAVPGDPLTLGLSVEAAAAFEGITRSGVVNQIERSLWPGIFRAHRYVSAVEYVQCQRARSMHMAEFEQNFGDYDVILASDRGGSLLISTNLTGHPQLYIPLGPDSRGRSRGLSLIGRLYGEASLVALGAAIQNKLGFHRQRPMLEG